MPAEYPIAAHNAARGCDMYFSTSAKAAANISPGQANLYGFEVSQPNAADAYIQFYDAAAADVTVGTTTPKASFFIPAAGVSNRGARDLSFVVPISFATRISYAITTEDDGATLITTAGTLNAWYK